MKKQFTAFMLTLVLCLGLAVPASAAGFSDVPADHWSYEQINRCVQDGIVSGYSDGTFKPGNPVSYGAFSIMLARAFYASELAGYSDQGTATGKAIMNKHGILSGTSRSSKSIGDPLPREDMAQCMYNVLVDKGAKIPSVQEQCSHISSIPDYDNVAYSCCTGVLVCYSLGLLGGQSDGNFGPKNSMNRAQGCVVINRLRDYFQNNGGTTTPVTPPEQPETPVDPPVEPTPTEPTTPTVTELPEFKLLPGEDVDAMMARINAATLAWREGYLSDGNLITESNISTLLNEFRENFPQDTKWDESDFYRYRESSFGSSAFACSAFASVLSDSIFGKNAPLNKHQNFDKLKVGDALWIKNTANGYNHMVFVTKIDFASGKIYSCSGNHGGKVNWNGYTTFEILNRDTVAPNTFVYSRY